MSPTSTASAHLPAIHLPAMSFLSPQSLWLLLLLPLAVATYVMLLRRRKRAAVRYGNFGMLKQAVGGGSRLRRHIPPALFLAAFALMLIGIARPTAVMSVYSHKSTVILAMDVSGSMRATDIKPSRVEAMQSAAKAFIAQQPPASSSASLPSPAARFWFSRRPRIEPPSMPPSTASSCSHARPSVRVF